VISKCFDIHAEAASESAALINPIPDLKKDWWMNLTVTRKEHPSEFYTTPTDLFLNTRLDRSSREKNSPNSAGTGLLVHSRNGVGNISENGRQNRSSVTTNHVFRPNERRRTGFLLPISQPNFDFLNGNTEVPGGRGGQLMPPPKVPYR
jgi:hypothetical protein